MTNKQKYFALIFGPATVTLIIAGLTSFAPSHDGTRVILWIVEGIIGGLCILGCWIDAGDMFEDYTRYSSSVQLTFDQFLKFYSLNPSAFSCTPYVVYFYYKENRHDISFKTFSDFLEYEDFLQDKTHMEEVEKDNKITLEFLHDMQKSINEMNDIIAKETKNRAA